MDKNPEAVDRLLEGVHPGSTVEVLLTAIFCELRLVRRLLARMARAREGAKALVPALAVEPKEKAVEPAARQEEASAVQPRQQRRKRADRAGVRLEHRPHG